MLVLPNHPPQIAEARQCIYRNHLFLAAVLAMFEEESGWAPPHLAPANAAADEYEDKVGAAVAPQDHDKARCEAGRWGDETAGPSGAWQQEAGVQLVVRRTSGARVLFAAVSCSMAMAAQ